MYEWYAANIHFQRSFEKIYCYCSEVRHSIQKLVLCQFCTCLPGISLVQPELLKDSEELVTALCCDCTFFSSKLEQLNFFPIVKVHYTLYILYMCIYLHYIFYIIKVHYILSVLKIRVEKRQGTIFKSLTDKMQESSRLNNKCTQEEIGELEIFSEACMLGGRQSSPPLKKTERTKFSPQ